MLLANIEERETKASPRGTVFILRCRDFRRLCFMIPTEEHAVGLQATFDALTIPRKPSLSPLTPSEQPKWLFCFFYKPRDVAAGVSPVSVADEYTRMGIPNDKWRISDYNRAFMVILSCG